MPDSNSMQERKLKENVDQSDCVLPETMEVLTNDLRYIFMGIFIIISVASLIGNSAAIYSVNKRKYRCIQKTCIISLAISDIMSTIIIAVNNLETFSHELLIWVSSLNFGYLIHREILDSRKLSLFVYPHVSNDWNFSQFNSSDVYFHGSVPKCGSCLKQKVESFTFSLLNLHRNIMVDQLRSFIPNKDITVIYFNVSGNIVEVDAHLCITFDKDTMRTYYIIMVIIVFLPLLLVFLWFYYNIASLIWKHRNPLSTIFKNSKLDNVSLKNRDIRVERKIRTFKIIITLMIVFIVCRLPYFTIFILKLSLPSKEVGLWTWILNYVFTAFQIVNCCLNPLLYTFLNQTLAIWVKIKKLVKDFTWEICCFCFSNAEFEEFEKENPFVENYEQRSNRNSKIKFQENVQAIHAKY
ncbi:7tm 1 domain containing protein, partial [Asbolus verrucosus]